MSLKSYASKRVYATKEAINKIQKECKLKEEYEFIDIVYGSKNLDKRLEWIRNYQKTSWKGQNPKKFAAFVKDKISFPKGFQRFTMPIGKPYKEFKTLKEAEKALGKNKPKFKFKRQGKTYQKGDLKIFVEKMRGLPTTIEVLCTSKSLSENKKKVDKFLGKYKLKDIIKHQVAELVRKK